ncbi:MAG: alpha-L-arabinofuranosidase [Catenulispora sp.]|nr:alpha-L-arabinofuranosidase [Catenulispora sp.]
MNDNEVSRVSGVSRRNVLRGTALGVVGAAALPAAATGTAFADSGTATGASPLALTVDSAHPGHAVSPELYGAFFEEINYAGVGGLYPELIRNRTFMDPNTPTAWYTPDQIPRVAGKFGGAVQLGGGSPAQYMQLPPGIVNGLTDFSVAAWVKPASISQWMRVFDFGTGTTDYMFLSLNAGHAPRFAISVTSYYNEQQVNAPDPLPVGEWSHLAVTLSGTTATLYVNGSAVATNTAMTLNPSGLPATTQNYIGRSQWAPDPYLDGCVDEFQIYDRALSAAEVASLQTSAGGAAGGGNVAWYRFDEAKGAVAVDSSGKGANGTIELFANDWTEVTDGGAVATAVLDAAAGLNSALTRSLRLDFAAAVASGQRAGMANGGYFGVPIVPGQNYRVSFFAKASTGFHAPLTVCLESGDGKTTYVSGQVYGIGSGWQQFSTVLHVPKSATASTSGRFVIGVDNRRGGATAGTVAAGSSVWLQVVSVFPPTYRNRKNGLRPDLVDLLQGMSPKILRFPGGNYIEGNTIDTRWDWKKTIGPVWERPGHQNSAWGYFSDDGLGLLEYLQLAEDLCATPVLGVWAGYTLNGTVVAEADLGPYIQDALDLVEYVTGPITSTWGARRAADGHPAPFKTPYLEIGNEDWLDRSGSYEQYRYAAFYDALKAAHPDIKLIATTAVTSRPMDVLDLHYYQDESWFENASTMFDSYDRTGPRIFVGEYAGTANAGGLATGFLGNSLGEAAFMTGLERNSDIVQLTAYAPLFANYGHTQWNPNLIGYDQIESYGSTSYYVQALFSNNVGDKVVPMTASASGLYYSATIDTRSSRVYVKVVNPAGTAVSTRLTFTGRTGATASVQVLANADDSVGNTLAAPNAITPSRSSISGSGGMFDYTAPAHSLTVITVSPR